MQPFTIVLDSDFSDLWRYNIVVMCSVQRDGAEVEFLKHNSEIAPVGAELREIPRGYNANRRIELHTQPADALTLYIYVVPHSLPRVESIAMAEAFDLRVEVMFDDKPLYGHTHEINQWSGENIEITL